MQVSKQDFYGQLCERTMHNTVWKAKTLFSERTLAILMESGENNDGGFNLAASTHADFCVLPRNELRAERFLQLWRSKYDQFVKMKDDGERREAVRAAKQTSAALRKQREFSAAALVAEQLQIAEARSGRKNAAAASAAPVASPSSSSSSFSAKKESGRVSHAPLFREVVPALRNGTHVIDATATNLALRAVVENMRAQAPFGIQLPDLPQVDRRAAAVATARREQAQRVLERLTAAAKSQTMEQQPAAAAAATAAAASSLSAEAAATAANPESTSSSSNSSSCKIDFSYLDRLLGTNRNLYVNSVFKVDSSDDDDGDGAVDMKKEEQGTKIRKKRSNADDDGPDKVVYMSPKRVEEHAKMMATGDFSSIDGLMDVINDDFKKRRKMVRMNGARAATRGDVDDDVKPEVVFFDAVTSNFVSGAITEDKVFESNLKRHDSNFRSKIFSTPKARAVVTLPGERFVEFVASVMMQQQVVGADENEDDS